VRAFQWILAAKDPLTVEILLAAVCQDPEVDVISTVDIEESYLLSSCENLITISPDRIVRVSHLSVAEYLEKKSELAPGSCAETIAKVCMTVLIQSSKQGVIPRSSLQDFAGEFSSVNQNLYSRAAAEWIPKLKTLHAEQREGIASTLLERFIGLPHQPSLAYVEWHRFQESLLYLDQLVRDLSPPTNPFFAVVHLGFEDVLSRWLNEFDTAAKQANHDGQSLLTIALEARHHRTVQLLLDHGAEINGQALLAACWQGDIDTIELLLNQGVDVNTKLNGEFGSMLAVVCLCQYWSVVRLLLARGADVNSKLGRRYGSTLVAACCGGDLDTVQLLLDHGAPVNMKPDGGGFWQCVGRSLNAKAACQTKLTLYVLISTTRYQYLEAGYFLD